MTLVHIFVNIEATHDTVNELGKLGVVQFKDLNEGVSAFQRNFVREIKRADKIEKKLLFFLSRIRAYNEIALAKKRPLIQLTEEKVDLAGYELDELEASVEEVEGDMKLMIRNQESLIENLNRAFESYYTLSFEKYFFKTEMAKPSVGAMTMTMNRVGEEMVHFGYLTGTVKRKDLRVFKGVLFRITCGNMYIRSRKLPDGLRSGVTEEVEQRDAFIVFYQGQAIEAKIRKICSSFSCNLFAVPPEMTDRSVLLSKLEANLSDLELVLQHSLDQQYVDLSEIARNLNTWILKVRKEKAIYHTMNMFDYDAGKKCLIAEGWIPTKYLDDVNCALSNIKVGSGVLVPSIMTTIDTYETPPTFFETNKFTGPFQDVINAYGIPRYREINPTPFFIITISFMFGLMFGDVGHGICLLIFSLYMIIRERHLKDNMSSLMEMPFNGRYIILLMSLFSIYAGLIYNEFLSTPIRLFKSQWIPNIATNNSTYKMADPSRSYEFGVDWMWKGSYNELIYYNSLKMKMSVIIGVLHMSLGIILKIINSIYFGHGLELIEAISQIVMLLSLFGYMCTLIIIKWLYPFYKNDLEHPNSTNVLHTHDAPQLITIMIFMFMSPTKLPPPPTSTTKDPIPLFPHQLVVQQILLIVAILCVPIMFLVKPLVLRHRHLKSHSITHLNNSYSISDDQKSVSTRRNSFSNDGKKLINESTKNDHHHGMPSHPNNGEFDFMGLMVNQMIETIEFSLGTISNTASYLRLWALSLAHSELSSVFWNMALIQYGLHPLNPFLTVVFWGVFCGASAIVLLMLESLSAFLHSLRLHWVEFQNKFYKGDGYLFQPFVYDDAELTVKL